MLPDLSDLADTAFTNNLCLWYPGQERVGSDSVIRVDFEPVPWLDKERGYQSRPLSRDREWRAGGQ